jgi:hypothetical protein
VDEFRYRYANFKVNVDAVANHNRDLKKSYKLAINHLADLSQEDVCHIESFETMEKSYYDFVIVNL